MENGSIKINIFIREINKFIRKINKFIKKTGILAEKIKKVIKSGDLLLTELIIDS